MDDHNSRGSRCLNLPDIEDMPHIAHAPAYPHVFMSVSAYDVMISRGNLERYLTKQGDLIEALTSALPMMERVRKGETYFQRRQRDFCTFHINAGLYNPTVTPPWDRIEDGIDYLTVYATHLDTHQAVGFRQYISMALHQRRAEEADRRASRGLENIVSKHIRRGVSNGIEKLAAQIPTTLEKIREEKAQLLERLEALEAAESKLQEKVRRRKERTSEGYVYLLREANGTHYKIGRTRNPENRLRTFSVKLPFQVEYDHLIQTDDMYALEAELHQRFAHCRVDGEWFALTPDEVAHIRGL